MPDDAVSQAQIAEIMRTLGRIERSQSEFGMRLDNLHKIVTDHLVTDATALATIDTSLKALTKSVNDDISELKSDVNRRSWLAGIGVGIAGLAQLMGIKLPPSGG